MRELKRGEIETAAAVPGTFSVEEKHSIPGPNDFENNRRSLCVPGE
jgi:hypothetical protein